MQAALSRALAAGVAAAALAGSAPAASAPACSAGAVHGNLTAVTAVSDSDAWAVGWTSDGQAARTLIEHWDGSAWCVVPSPDPGGTAVPSDALYGVAATSATDAWAVGYGQAASGNYQTIILHWDGTAWTVVPSPDPVGPSEDNYLIAVSAASPSDAWAVGYYSFHSAAPTLIAHWDGTSWTQLPAPHAGAATSDNALVAVAAGSVGTWAAGLCGCPWSSLTERWNGTAWTLVKAPHLGSLSGVAETSASNAWAAGGYWNGFTDLTLILHWNGTAWKRVPSPDRGTGDLLSGIAAASRGAAWAVGSYYDGRAYRALILRWASPAWKISPSPDVGGQNQLLAVAATSPASAWAVGDHWTLSGGLRTLILHWDSASWTRVPSP